MGNWFSSDSVETHRECSALSFSNIAPATYPSSTAVGPRHPPARSSVYNDIPESRFRNLSISEVDAGSSVSRNNVGNFTTSQTNYTAAPQVQRANVQREPLREATSLYSTAVGLRHPPARPAVYNDILESQFRNLGISEVNAGSSISRNNVGNFTTSQTNYTAAPQVQKVNVQRNPLHEAKLVEPSNISFIVSYISDYALALNWEGNWQSQSSVKFARLDWDSDEFQYVKELFDETNKRCFQVTQIERIQNPYLLAAFLLKKEEMEKRIGYQDIEELFHGTKNECLWGICTDNLDWRLYGQNIGNKFGQGISFTPISNYATHYGDNTQNNRVMLLVHVLVGNECIGDKYMELPPDGFDTTTKPDRHVIVKYEDNEFYPAYKITYSCTDADELKRRKNNNKHNYHVR